MKLFKKSTIVTALLFTAVSFSQEGNNSHTGHNHTRPDSHAPIGVMGDHTHKKGEFMFSYRVMGMWMEDMLKGDRDISNAGVLQNGYPVTPTEMQMEMHMLGAMYAVSDKVTLMAMASYKSNTMDLIVIPSGLNFTTNSSGFGDVKIGALINVLEKENHKLHTNLSLSIPTGSIDQRDDIPVKSNSLLAYPMQIGSGTWDPTLGATYTGHNGLLGWGAQGLYTVSLGENDNGYRLGNKMEATAWGSIQADEVISFSARVKYTETQRISGQANELTTPFTAMNGNTIVLANLMPLFNTENSGRKQLDVSIGTNILMNNVTKGLRLGIEAGIPVYQDVNGIQMKNRFMTTIGIQYAL